MSCFVIFVIFAGFVPETVGRLSGANPACEDRPHSHEVVVPVVV